MHKLSLAVAACVALTACTDSMDNFNRPSGAIVDQGDFGNSTMNNMLAHQGKLRIDLARRFAAEVDSDVTFAFNSTALSANARATLREQANWIKQFPEVKFKVYGHTDLVGNAAYNRNLGLRRAQAVVLYLTSQGISRSRLEAVVSFGETRPLVASQTREQQNRRTVTEVMGFDGRHPTVLNGKYANIIFREYVESGQQTPSL